MTHYSCAKSPQHSVGNMACDDGALQDDSNGAVVLKPSRPRPAFPVPLIHAVDGDCNPLERK